MRPESNRTPSSQDASEGREGGKAIHRYPMAPLIRLTLIGLYLALVLPLPVLAPPTLRWAMLGAVPMGLILVVAATSEMVEIDSHGIRVGHPPWCRWLLRRGWTLAWDQVVGLTPVATSQGGRVYYVRGRSSDPDQAGQPGEPAERKAIQAYLLPQRVARFEEFLVLFSRSSGIDTSEVIRITPPWTYRLLAVLSGILLGGEVLFLGLQ